MCCELTDKKLSVSEKEHLTLSKDSRGIPVLKGFIQQPPNLIYTHTLLRLVSGVSECFDRNLIQAT